MARRVFFSFHYQDVIDFRANVVRNHWVTKPDREASGYFDASLWESTKRQGSYALKRLIDSGLQNTSVTCVLVGTFTYLRPWVRYEIFRSIQRGNKIFGVHINSISGKDGYTKPLGQNPFSELGYIFSSDGKEITLYEKINGEWYPYKEVDGNASYTLSNAQPHEANNSYNLSRFYPVYDWVRDNGYENFASWVDQ